jgi:hypothetical protein
MRPAAPNVDLRLVVPWVQVDNRLDLGSYQLLDDRDGLKSTD